jgi:hypothetical protein
MKGIRLLCEMQKNAVGGLTGVPSMQAACLFQICALSGAWKGSSYPDENPAFLHGCCYIESQQRAGRSGRRKQAFRNPRGGGGRLQLRQYYSAAPKDRADKRRPQRG